MNPQVNIQQPDETRSYAQQVPEPILGVMPTLTSNVSGVQKKPHQTFRIVILLVAATVFGLSTIFPSLGNLSVVVITLALSILSIVGIYDLITKKSNPNGTFMKIHKYLSIMVFLATLGVIMLGILILFALS